MNEVHVYRAANGHCDSSDCWCEPVTIYLYKNAHGLLVKIIEHDDFESLHLHRSGMILAREVVQDWVTRYLDAIPTNSGGH